MAREPWVWNVNIDESGDFNHSAVSTTSVVVGLLNPVGQRALLEDALREVLISELPHLQRLPLHTWLIQRLSYQVLLYTVGERLGQPVVYAQTGRTEHCREAAAWLQRVESEIYEEQVSRILSGEEPEFAALTFFERRLQQSGQRRHRFLFLALRRYARADLSRLQLMLSELSDRAQGRAYAVIATREDDEPQRQGDLYMILLRSLLLRAIHVLQEIPGDHVLRLHVQGRNVLDSFTGRMRRMEQRHLNELLSDLQRVYGAEEGWFRRGDSRVRLQLWRVVWRREDYRAMDFFADLVANRSYATFRRIDNGTRSDELRALEQSLETQLGLRCRLHTGVSTLTAGPELQNSLSAFSCLDSTERVSTILENSRPWARTQYLQWRERLLLTAGASQHSSPEPPTEQEAS
jgi:hypothetical protein